MEYTTIDYVDNPKQIALYASSILSADKGISNEIVVAGNGYDVVTNIGLCFAFRKKDKSFNTEFHTL